MGELRGLLHARIIWFSMTRQEIVSTQTRLTVKDVLLRSCTQLRVQTPSGRSGLVLKVPAGPSSPAPSTRGSTLDLAVVLWGPSLMNRGCAVMNQRMFQDVKIIIMRINFSE